MGEPLVEAEMRWHMQSTCHIIQLKREQISLMPEVAIVIEPVYLAVPLP